MSGKVWYEIVQNVMRPVMVVLGMDLHSVWHVVIDITMMMASVHVRLRHSISHYLEYLFEIF